MILKRFYTGTLPDYVVKILDVLENKGNKAYIVGGAVRDLLLGIKPGDFDIATSARPDKVLEAAKEAGWETVDKLGKNFGVVILLVDGVQVEVATFRGEKYSYDAHKPEEVWFVDSLEEDLARRDFTVNAMALDKEGTVYDYHGGMSDLDNRVLRTVGNPEKRYREDALRMFRACRFVAQLGFTYIEGNDTVAGKCVDLSLAAAEKNLRENKKIPLTWGRNLFEGDYIDRELTGTEPEQEGFGEKDSLYYLPHRYHFPVEKTRGLSLPRVRNELEKMLLSPYAGKGLMLFLSTGLASAYCIDKSSGEEKVIQIIPEIEHLAGTHQNRNFHCCDVWEHTLMALDKTPRTIEQRWTMLLHDVAKGLDGVRNYYKGLPSDHGHEKAGADMTPGILSRLGYGDKFIKQVAWMVAGHMKFAPMMFFGEKSINKWVRKEAASGNFRNTAEMKDAFTKLVDIFLADMGSTWAGVLEKPVMEEGRQLGRETIELAEKMPVHTSDLAVNGGEVRAVIAEFEKEQANVAESEKALKVSEAENTAVKISIGECMQYLLKRTRAGNLSNEKECLKEALRKKLRRTENNKGFNENIQLKEI